MKATIHLSGLFVHHGHASVGNKEPPPLISIQCLIFQTAKIVDIIVDVFADLVEYPEAVVSFHLHGTQLLTRCPSVLHLLLTIVRAMNGGINMNMGTKGDFSDSFSSSFGGRSERTLSGGIDGYRRML
jgi:hypothetical protein